MSDVLTIAWHPNLEDARFAVRRTMWGGPKRVVQNIVLVFILPAATFGWIVLASMRFRMTLEAILLPTVGFALAWGLSFNFLYREWLARVIVKRQRALGDTHRIAFGPEGFEIQLKDAKLSRPWSAVTRIEEIPAAFLFFGPSGLVTAIGKSGIQSVPQLQALRALLRTRNFTTYMDAAGTQSRRS